MDDRARGGLLVAIENQVTFRPDTPLLQQEDGSVQVEGGLAVIAVYVPAEADLYVFQTGVPLGEVDLLAFYEVYHVAFSFLYMIALRTRSIGIISSEKPKITSHCGRESGVQ